MIHDYLSCVFRVVEVASEHSRFRVQTAKPTPNYAELVHVLFPKDGRSHGLSVAEQNHSVVKQHCSRK